MTDTEAGGSGTGMAQTHEEARKLRDEAWERSGKVYKEAKEQADAVYEGAKKLAADKEAIQRADEAHAAALKEAKALRDAITGVAESVFADFWRK
jgi:SpoVK/Ycf46/Vps4 family AAA+-type ATPase